MKTPKTSQFFGSRSPFSVMLFWALLVVLITQVGAYYGYGYYWYGFDSGSSSGYGTGGYSGWYGTGGYSTGGYGTGGYYGSSDNVDDDWFSWYDDDSGGWSGYTTSLSSPAHEHTEYVNFYNYQVISVLVQY